MREKYVLKLEGKEWKECLDKSFNKQRKDLKVDGFRKGQVPKEVFIKKFGYEKLYTDAVDYAIDILYTRLFKDSNTIIPAATPSIDITNINKDEIEVEFTVVSSPEVKLGKYKDLKLIKKEAEVSTEEIDHEIEHLKEHFVDVKVLDENHEIKEGDIAVIDFKGYLNDKAFDGGEGKDYSLTIGSHTFIPGFEEGLVGLKKGDKKDLNVTFPKNYQSEKLKGKDVVFKVEIKDVKERIMPELNKEFFEDLGIEKVTNEEELKKYIENNLKEQKERKINDNFLFECLDKIRETSKFEIPEEMTNDEVNRMVKEFSDKLSAQGLNLNDYIKFTGSNLDTFKENLKEEANRRISYRILLDEIIKEEKLEISDKELEDELEKVSKEYNVSKEEFLKEIGSKDMFKYDLLVRKASEIITK